MNIGVAGTRKGMTAAQEMNVLRYLVQCDPMFVHHGDCVGVDEMVHAMATYLEWGDRIYIHPPDNDTWRAFCQHPEAKRNLPMPYLVRNRSIVSAADVLLVVPKETEVVPRGTRGAGTWTTYWYAKDAGVPTVIFWPDGREESDG